MRRPGLLLLASLLLALLVAAEVSASEASWLINIKAVDPVLFGGGTSVRVGVGATANTGQLLPPSASSTAQAERTLNYGDTTQWHERHDVVRNTEGGERYYWDLKIGARANYQYSTVNICLWNSQISFAGIGGELNHDLAYVFAKRVADNDQVLAWFSDSSLMNAFVDQRPGMTSALWHNTSVLLKNASTWNPIETSDHGFYVTDTVTKGIGFSALGDYRLYAFDQSAAQNWSDPAPLASEDTPEPTSLLALGSGLLGAAGLALRRRRK